MIVISSLEVPGWMASESGNKAVCMTHGNGYPLDGDFLSSTKRRHITRQPCYLAASAFL